jgi:hypothetical protein
VYAKMKPTHLTHFVPRRTMRFKNNFIFVYQSNLVEKSVKCICITK